MKIEDVIPERLAAAIGLAMVLGACKAPAPEKPVAVGRPSPAVFDASVPRVDVAEAARPGAAIAEEDEVVDFALPRGCDRIYDPKDACKTLRGLIETPYRMNNRACLARMSGMIPGYAISCGWIEFSSHGAYGYGADCYNDRFKGAGVVCTIRDDQNRADASPHFEATEKLIRGCLDGWTLEQTAKTRVLIDRGFSISNRIPGDAGAMVTTRVQACRYTDEPRHIDEHAQAMVRLEIFTESPDAAAR